jgi:hypothetical protein
VTHQKKGSSTTAQTLRQTPCKPLVVQHSSSLKPLQHRFGTRRKLSLIFLSAIALVPTSKQLPHLFDRGILLVEESKSRFAQRLFGEFSLVRALLFRAPAPGRTFHFFAPPESRPALLVIRHPREEK